VILALLLTVLGNASAGGAVGPRRAHRRHEI